MPLRSGGEDWPSKPVGMASRTIVQPIPLQPGSERVTFKNYERNLGTLKLQIQGTG